MAETSMKVHELAKELKVPSKEVLARLAEHGIEVKSYMSVLTEEQASAIFEIYTQMCDDDEQEIKTLHNRLIKQAAEEKAAAEAAAEEQRKAEARLKTMRKKQNEIQSAKTERTPAAGTEEKPVTAEKKPERNAETAEKKIHEKTERRPEEQQKSKPEAEVPESNKKPEANAVKKAEEKTVSDTVQPENASEKKKPKREKHENRQKKKSGQRIEFVRPDAVAGDEYKVETSERKRYVDTRTSTVEIEKIESRERIEELVPENIRFDTSRKQKNKKSKQAKQELEKPELKKEKHVKVITEVEIPETITVGELAAKLGKGAAEIVKKLMMLGVMATITQTIDFDTAALIGEDFGITVNKEIVLTKEDILFNETDVPDDESDLVPRPPVVVVMGHVDHGKTSLLDAIRDTAVTESEAGGITQHIGAYSVRLNDRDITFLDTPGHEAFTTMRARGAQVTDVAILVVAADDGIMPQTIEAINHAKAAGVTIVVAINKIDKEGANPDKVRQMLMEHELVPEEWGGDTVCVEVSAKKRINIDGLLEMVLLIADMQELKANPNRTASGTVIEAQIDKGRGPVATVLVQNGTLKVGDVVIAGTAVGRIRAMVNDKGRRVKSAAPSMPVEILGLSEAPSGGDKFVVVSNEKLARDVAEKRKQDKQEDKFNKVIRVNLDNLFSQIDEGNMKELNVIIKADVQGSVEAVKQSLEKLSNDEVRVRAIHGGVGAINESDVMLANASNAIIVGFNVRPDAGAVSAAERQEVDIRLYRVIYQAIEEIEAAMKGMLDPEFKEVITGHAEIRQTFKVSGVGTIAGCYVTDGKIQRNSSIRIVRNGIVVHEGNLASLKRFKDDAKEVTENFECGMSIENFNDIKEGDIVECFAMEEIKR